MTSIRTEELIYTCTHQIHMKKAPLLIITNHAETIACTLNIPFFPIMIISHGFHTLPYDEQHAIIMHEFGHIENDGPYTTALLSSFVISWIISQETHMFSSVVFTLCLYGSWAILLLALFYAKRQSEYKADLFSYKNTHNPNALIHALQREGRLFKRRPYPHLFLWLETHPSPEKRIQALTHKHHTILPATL